MSTSSVQRVIPGLFAVAAIFSVQFGNAFVGSFFGDISPLGAASARLAFAAIILLAIVRPSVRGWDRGTWLTTVGLGIALAGMNTCIYLAFERIPMGIAVTIELLGPLCVAAIGSRRLLDFGWVLLALAGVVTLGLSRSGSGEGFDVAGAGFAAAAAVFWGLYIVMSARLGPRVKGVDGIAIAIGVAAAAALPLGAAPAAQSFVADPMLILIFIGAAVMTSALPYALEFIALRRIPTRVFGVLSSLGPAVAALAGLLVLGQALAPIQVGAIALVVAACAGVVAFAGKK